MRLEPIGAAERDLLRAWAAERGPVLSAECARDIRRWIGDPEAVALVDACCSLRGYGDCKRWRTSEREALAAVRRQGCRLRRGKRTRPEVAAFVHDLAGVLLGCGVPLATGDNARMVEILRRVADELRLQVDPRTELRRQVSAAAARRGAIRRTVAEAVASTLKP